MGGVVLRCAREQCQCLFENGRKENKDTSDCVGGAGVTSKTITISWSSQEIAATRPRIAPLLWAKVNPSMLDQIVKSDGLPTVAQLGLLSTLAVVKLSDGLDALGAEQHQVSDTGLA